MNDIANTTLQTPIEIALGIDENGMTTARKLYEFLDMPTQNFARWAKSNIEDNEFYEENKDWWGFFIVKNGNNCKDYRLTTDFAKHLSMESHSSKGKIARNYFVAFENKEKQLAIDRSQLSPQTQALMSLVEGQARQELEQKRMAEQLKRVEQKQEVIAETFKKPSDIEDFKVWCKKCILKIAKSNNFAIGLVEKEKYALAWNESYERLNKKRPCRLKQRVNTAQGEALRSGATSSKVREINALTIIANDKDLKPVYEMVIKEMMLYYCV